MDSGRIHPRVWTLMLLQGCCIIFGKLVRSGHVPDDWKRANVICVYKNGPKENPGNYKPINLNFNLNLIPGKVMEQVQLETITNQMNQVTGRSSHDFTKGKSCMTNLIFLQQKKTIFCRHRLVCEVGKKLANRMVLKDPYSYWLHVISWIPQGLILGPTLFNIIINLNNGVENILTNFVDDTKLCGGVDMSERKTVLETWTERVGKEELYEV